MAVALSVRQDRSPSLDLDAIASDQAVFDEANTIAAERGLPPHWLNDAAQPWLPPRPPEALRPRTGPGLDVHIAPPEHLLAMKIIAFRDRDVDDIVDLASALNLTTASAEQLADLVAGVYGTPERLALALGGPDKDAPRNSCSSASASAASSPDAAAAPPRTHPTPPDRAVARLMRLSSRVAGWTAKLCSTTFSGT